MSIPGVGPLISTAMVAAIGTGEAFDRGRDFGAWLGLVPRQYSTGGKSILGHPSEETDISERCSLKRRALSWCYRTTGKNTFGTWLKDAINRLHRNKAATALANKLARIAWSVLRNDKAFDTFRHEVPAIWAEASNSSRLKQCMERINERTQSLMTLMVARQPVR
jgi:transposase